MFFLLVVRACDWHHYPFSLVLEPIVTQSPSLVTRGVNSIPAVCFVSFFAFCCFLSCFREWGWRDRGKGRDRILSRLHSQCRVWPRAQSHNPDTIIWAEIKSQTPDQQSHLGTPIPATFLVCVFSFPLPPLSPWFRPPLQLIQILPETAKHLPNPSSLVPPRHYGLISCYFCFSG